MVSDTTRLQLPTDHSALDLYLALLQDRLPVYVGTVSEVLGRVGQGTVRENLRDAARATIDFYCQILAAKLAVIADPLQVARLRQVLLKRGMGQHQAEENVARYLRLERDAGGVGAGVEPGAVARLLIGACINYAFNRLLMGESEIPERGEYAADIVRGISLG
ncbi:hypothetical protein J4573_26720 [Actinomadura barringtoniae]|uniref:Uncharacterized protein n=1 Tax=Actinomadura barringtoniae TaxID=1427535 RepID=A0A939T376_9ACTN|nr:hypothetical protein [Actinomadura barringtoniae]MBO2450726.1 hypothetical protein [Actinomadura barringtoniae]